MTLAWFEKLPNTDAYRIGGHFAPYAVLTRPVRFSDAELAAEMWMQYAGLFYFIKEGKPQTKGKRERQATINRFAAYAHFDEEN